MTTAEKIKAYWQRINKIEERISELDKRGVDYSQEWKKRKVMLRNVNYLEKLI